HPQQRVEKPPIVRARAALTAPAARNKVLEPFPLVVTKSVAVHRCSPKNSVESDLRAFGNPKTLNCHYALGRDAESFARRDCVAEPDWRANPRADRSGTA